MTRIGMTLCAFLAVAAAHVVAAFTSPGLLAAQDPTSRSLDASFLMAAAKPAVVERIVDPYMALAQLAELEAVSCTQRDVAVKVTVICTGYVEPVDVPAQRQGRERERKSGSLDASACTSLASVDNSRMRHWIDDGPDDDVVHRQVSQATSCR
jgi:hypothetical protein